MVDYIFGRENLPTDKKCVYVYVDNLGILGASRRDVGEKLATAIHKFQELGLATHEGKLTAMRARPWVSTSIFASSS